MSEPDIAKLVRCARADRNYTMRPEDDSVLVEGAIGPVSAAGERPSAVSYEIRRVPLDFDWPLRKPWKGHSNPYEKPCPEENRSCFSGYTGAGQWLEAVARLITLLAEEALSEPHAEELRARGRVFPHPDLVEWNQAPRFELSREDRETLDRFLRPYPPGVVRAAQSMRWQMNRGPLPLVPFGQELVALASGLVGRPLASVPIMGGGETWEITKKLKQAAGVDVETWGLCPVCKGHTIDPAFQERHEAWQREEPPSGPGWQLWETASDEGSPVSSVFPDEAAFRAYLLRGSSAKAVDGFITHGSVPSALFNLDTGHMARNIECAAAIPDASHAAPPKPATPKSKPARCPSVHPSVVLSGNGAVEDIQCSKNRHHAERHGCLLDPKDPESMITWAQTGCLL